MILKKTPVTFILLLCTLFAIATPSLNINFIENNIEVAQEKARLEHKLIMVDFWASWCSPCKWMDEQTFSQPRVAKYLNDNYITVRVDIDKTNGIAYKNKYEVRFLPTVLVLDASGKVLKKYEESLAPSKLLRILEDLNDNKVLSSNVNPNMVQSISKSETRKIKKVKSAPTYTPYTTGTSRKVLAKNKRTPQDKKTYQLSQPVTRKEKENQYRPSSTTQQANKNTYSGIIYKASSPGKLANTPIKNYAAPTFDAVSDIGLYQFNVKKAPRHGFSVQVGAYYDYKNVLEEVAKFQKSFAEEVLVHISELNGATCYKVMLGHYNSYEAARNDKKLLIEVGAKDAFIKDLSQLKATGDLATVRN